MWHIVNVRYTASGERTRQRVFRRITIGPEERLRTAAERISLLAVEDIKEEIRHALAMAPCLNGMSKHSYVLRLDMPQEEFEKRADFFFKENMAAYTVK